MMSWINITVYNYDRIYFYVNEMKIDNKSKNIIKKSIEEKNVKLYMNLYIKPDTYPMSILINKYDEVYIYNFNERFKILPLAYRIQR